MSSFPTKNASQSVRDAYDRWTKANDNVLLYILANMSDILSKKHEIMIKQEAIKYVYNARMKEGQSVREHVLNKIVNFNVAQMNGAVFDEKNQVSYILKSLSKSFLQFRSNMEMNKIEYNMTTLLKELQIFQSLMRQKEGEANFDYSRRFAPSSSGSKKIQKSKGGKGKGPTVAAEGKGKVKVAIKGKCFHCNVDEHWKRNCPKYLAKKKEKEDDYSRYGYLYLMEHKSEALEKFKKYKAEVENLLSKKIKILRSDRGGEYMDLRFQDYMTEHEIQSQLSAPVETAVHILNNVPLKSVFETPFELCLVGYPKETRGGLFFDPQENSVFVSTNTTFLEEDHMRDHKLRSKLVLNEATNESTRVVDEVGPSSRVDETITSGQSHLFQSLRMPRRSGRVVSQPNRYLGLTETQVVIPDDGVEDPLSYKQAMNDVDKNQWVKFIDLEMESMYFNSV
ncbi:gag/pol protein [Cucumis melo var. makuwa]|uniref:Gag/pol protein n=1 Tax=Cucumis melo var. makuwa TaxID=1194695 RepID=A0A5A7SKQ7_CUCMM|nr:gag/pol protein [Cucumis melo var. makuwa]TYK04449.1 gag/pol protein [Cucumis melo var. makuwa]